MKKTLFIAEKPSVAREYCEMLQAHEKQSFSKKDGYFESSDYFVSWCFGHLVTLAEPSEYGWEQWRVDDLPMIPEQWKYSLKEDAGARKQFKTIKELIGKSSGVVNGADPDREGELIVRLVLHLAGATNVPQERFWNRSMTLKDLISAWETRKGSKEYNNLYSAANCRQRADWLIGMNLSRAYSLKSGVKGISVGRVQTPTLAMIVNRDIEIENWRRSFFKELHGDYQTVDFSYIGDTLSGKTIEFITNEEKVELERLKTAISSSIMNTVKFEQKEKKAFAPLFYNLADAQKDANKIFGFSADKSLSLIQSLYEKKELSYPRTDCNYVTEDMYEDCLDLMKQLCSDQEFLNHLDPNPKSFNSSKVTAHTALIPTGTGSGLSGEEELMFNLVAKRFVLAFGAPKLLNQTEHIVSDGKHYFKTNHNQVVYPGWTLFLKEQDPDSDQEKSVAYTLSNQQVKFDRLFDIERERTKPSYFTEATLLTAMENAGKTLSDAELKEAIKSTGIGTPATRSGIIEQLKSKGFIVQNKKNLVSTEKGRSLIAAVSPGIKSAELTAHWEKNLAGIEEGSVSWKVFYDSLQSFTKDLVFEILEADEITISTPENKKYSCPDCGSDSLRINKGGAFCPEENGGCGLKLFRKQYGKDLPERAFGDLLTKRKTGSMSFKGKSKSYKAKLIRNGSNVKHEF